MGGNPLGRKVAIPGEYSPGVLHAIPREPVAGGGYPVCGLDHWRAYELSWLDAEGRPAVFVGEFLFPADSPNLVESKSLKLYLAGLNGERFARESLAAGRIVEDLSACCGAEVEARVWGLVSYPDNCRLAEFDLIDHHLPRQAPNGPDAGLLASGGRRVEDRKVRSELFRSLCPVTGQPDWASVALAYSGAEIDEAGLLSYLCAFRGEAAWHESCAERAFHDIMRACAPDQASLSLHFLRRGGLEINVYRATSPVRPKDLLGRDARQ